MPTYTINMRGDPAQNAWADAASALAQAFTPDYKGQAEGQVLASQADANYSRSAANLASRDKTLAETFEVNRRNDLLRKMDAELTAAGVDDPLDKSEIAAEYGMIIDPVEWTKNMGEGNLALGGIGAARQFEPGSDDYLSALQSGSGMSYGNTIGGTREAAQQENYRWAEEQAAAAADAQAERDAEMERLRWETGNKPLSLSENQVSVVPQGHPLWTEENQGVIVGQRSVGNTEQILAPGSTEPVATGPGFREDPAKAPDMETWQEGREKVTGFYDPKDPRANEFGYVETARGPLTTADGKTVMSPADEAFAADDRLSLEGALAAGQGAADLENDVTRLMSLIQKGTPTGFWTNSTLPIRQAAAQLGLADKKKLAQIEAVTSGLGNRVMDRIRETKGAVSNAEMIYFRKISASIGNSPAGNLMLLEGERRVHARNRELRDLALSMRGASAQEISAALEEHKRENPIWSPEEVENIQLMVPDEELGYTIGDAPRQGAGTTSTGATWEIVE